MSETSSEIGIAAIRKTGVSGKRLRLIGPVVDSALGLRACANYVNATDCATELSRIPQHGSVTIVANH